jgi:CDP-6-deoxy-D-xylo-4-hexulose-3-dehydrase
MGWCSKINSSVSKDDQDPRFSHDLIGYNFKAMEFQAALGLSQLDKIEWIIKRRQENVKYLNETLMKHRDVLQLPEYSEDVSYLAYPIVIIRPHLISRQELRARLENAGIETRPLFGCIPTQQKAYSHLKSQYEGWLPSAEFLGRNGFYIGCHQYLKEDDLKYIEKIFNKILQDKR